MLFWIICATLVAAIAFALAITLLRPRAGGVPEAARDVQLYRAQLSEVERDLSRGVLSPEEAARTRLEIQRRLLEADRAVQADGPTPEAPRGLTVAVAGLVVAALAGAFVLYDRLGAAGLADAPLKTRLAAADTSYENRPTQAAAEQAALDARGPMPPVDPQFATLMDKLRKAVQDRPNDPQGLALLAENEMNIGNFTAGWQAQRRLIALKGDQASSDDYTRLGEFQTVAADGLITAEAEAAFAKALEIDRGNAMALYYLGMMMGQNQRPDRAFRLWDAALRQSTPEDPWVPVIAKSIDTLAWLAGEESYTAPMPVPKGPSAEEMEAAADMAPEDRQAMIRGMVDTLNARLANEGGSAADWAKLISALRVLGEAARADAILTEARGKFATRPGDLEQIEAAAQTPLGVAAARGTPTEETPAEAAPAEPAPAGAALPGPSAEQIDAAAAMTDTERQEMITGMVGRLVERLETQGGSAEEWARAVGALASMGKAEDAGAMLHKAETALAGDTAGLALLAGAAKSAGVGQ